MGEIVSLSSSSAPADNPSHTLTGFVEGLTWSHVVIRDFDRKQVFVPHKNMTTMSIYNWSRQPGKQLSVTIQFTITHGGGGIAKVGQLNKFIAQWLKL